MNHCHKVPFDLEIYLPYITCNNSFVYFSVQLLVNNKIISLDLPVAEVYKKVWCTTNEVCVCSLAWWFYFSDVCRLVPGGAIVSHHIPSW